MKPKKMPEYVVQCPVCGHKYFKTKSKHEFYLLFVSKMERPIVKKNTVQVACTACNNKMVNKFVLGLHSV